ncbi:MAG TPA: potassium-transporting ATPase subunit KdpA [Stellaceae bacterium]|jgi:hypothetical protein|nr:potassium-transporting ATPase subunit KdpA [Stellaceae bacterium]
MGCPATASVTGPGLASLGNTGALGVICIVGGLSFLPALSLGPIAEQMMMQAGRLYWELLPL